MGSTSSTRTERRSPTGRVAKQRQSGTLTLNPRSGEPPQRRARKEAEPRPARDPSRATHAEDPDAVYDAVVHAGAPEPDEDVYDRLARVDGVDVEDDVIEELDPANLVATLERAHLRAEGDVPGSALDVDALDQMGDVERELRPHEMGEDDDADVSPEELGEQFLRGAAQQERRTRRDDAEPKQDVALLSDSVHDVSLFDHNLDPLADPQFSKVVTDETTADATHRSSDRRSAKRSATRQAEEQSAVSAETGKAKSKSKVNSGKPGQTTASPQKRAETQPKPRAGQTKTATRPSGAKASSRSSRSGK